MTILDPTRVDTEHTLGYLEEHHDSDIDALKQIVIGLTARVNEMEFTLRHPVTTSRKR